VASRLKVAGLPVFSVGALVDNDLPRDCRRHHWRGEEGAAATVVTRRGHLLGACGVGTLQEFQSLREAVEQGRFVAPWRLWRFRRAGRLWPERNEDDVAAWPAEAVVCNCARVTRGALSSSIAAGCHSLEAVGRATRAATACGSCRPLVLRLLAGDAAVPAVRGATVLVGAAVLALLVALLALSRVNLQDPPVVAGGVPPAFWRDALFKQVSGFVLVALVLLSLAITVRKRARAARGDTAWWRLVHVGLAIVAAALLLAHTGGRVGIRLNFALSMSFVLALVLGALTALAVAREHRDSGAVRVRRRMAWVHLACTWPLPALLVAHVMKAYFF
jgi:nitrite reductase (NADH) large subunit